MNISKVGLDLIKEYEGLRLTAYKPVASEQYWTIGYGHYGPDVWAGQAITRAQADAYLRSDVRRFEKAVNSAVKVSINQNQFDALVSFTYNLGEGTLYSSTLLQYVNKKQFGNAADEFLLFVNAGGQPLPGLVRRRKEERALFLKAYNAILWRYAREDLNLRTKADWDSSVGATVPLGYAAQINYGVQSNDFVQVIFREKKYWYKESLTLYWYDQDPAVVYTVVTEIGFRGQSKWDSRIVAKRKKGDKVRVVGTSQNGWLKCVLDDTVGYIPNNSMYLVK